MFRICHAFLSGHCSLVVTCWERAGLLALLYVMFYCVFVTFPCGVLGQVWYLIASIPDLCPLTYHVVSTVLQNRTEQNRTLLKIMPLRPLTGGVRDKHKHVMQ